MTAPLEAIRGVVVAMNEAFPKLTKAWRVRGCLRKNWKLLFDRLDLDQSGRLGFGEFEIAVSKELDLAAAVAALESQVGKIIDVKVTSVDGTKIVVSERALAQERGAKSLEAGVRCAGVQRAYVPR